MNSTQLAFETNGAGTSQTQRVLELLRARIGEWLSMPELERFSGSSRMNSRIADARKRLPPGWRIENRIEFRNRTCLSFYRLVSCESEDTKPME